MIITKKMYNNFEHQMFEDVKKMLQKEDCNVHYGQAIYDYCYHCFEHLEPQVLTLYNDEVNCFNNDSLVDSFLESLRSEVVGNEYSGGLSDDFYNGNEDSRPDIKDIPNCYFGVLDIASEKDRAEFKNQRLERGFDETELWNFDTTLASYIKPRLEVFKELSLGLPATLESNEWSDILDKMILAFDYIANEDERVSEKMSEVENAESQYENIRRDMDEKTQEGLKLFAEYFTQLWW